MRHLKPVEILDEIAASGIAKTSGSFRKLLILGIMAGAYIAFAGAGANMAAFGLLGDAETFGLGKLVSGAVFTGGLIMVVLAGAELFTGNTLITVSVMQKKTEHFEDAQKLGNRLHSKFYRFGHCVSTCILFGRPECR